MRKVTLSKGAALWEIGDTARTVAVIEKGTLGVRTAAGLVGIATTRTVLGEASIFTVEGEDQKRTAALVALDDDTLVTEYPAAMVKQAVDAGKDQVGPLILSTLVGQACRNLLIVISTHRRRPLLEVPLKTLMQSLIEQGRQVKPTSEWKDFMLSFRFLHDLRDYTENLREELTAGVGRAEASVKASDVVKDLFKGDDFRGYLEELLREEREMDKWLERSGSAVADE